jgi:RNA polymerase sigma factor (sigma-70 family)
MTDTAPHEDNRLLGLFDDDPFVAEEKLRMTRQLLVNWFRMKNCRYEEDLADETVFRALVAVETKNTEITTNIKSFMFGIAQNVLQEHYRDHLHKETSIEETPLVSEPHTESLDEWLREITEKEQLHECLEDCLEKLDPSDKDLIWDYYYSSDEKKLWEVRDKLAGKFGLTERQLIKRTFRIRLKLKECIKKCLKKAEQNL